MLLQHLECCCCIDVCTMEACNHSTLSASVIKAVTSVGIEFQDIIAFVTDSAAYCKKAARGESFCLLKFFSYGQSLAGWNILSK